MMIENLERESDMIQHGTVVNGVIVPEGTPPPEGTKVVYETAELFDSSHPMFTYDRANEVKLLRDRIAKRKAGVPGIPLTEAMARITKELNLPCVDSE